MSERPSWSGRITHEWATECGQCGRVEYGMTLPGRVKASFLLKSWGWKNTRRFGWSCPDCVNEKKGGA